MPPKMLVVIRKSDSICDVYKKKKIVFNEIIDQKRRILIWHM